MSAPCTILDWDSEFFGRTIARVEGYRLTPEKLADVLAFCRRERVECLYFLADPGHRHTSWLAQDAGFRLVDLRVTLDQSIEEPRQERTCQRSEVRPAESQDESGLGRIARTSHTDSRYFFDPGFSRTECEDLYEAWIRNSCRGFADAVLVVGHAGDPQGYITLHMDSPEDGRIGLFAVAPGGRGQGFGSALIRSALGRFRALGARRVSVVTQARNALAQRVYQKGGFMTRSVGVWFHYRPDLGARSEAT